MSVLFKQQVAGIVSTACVFIIVFCIARMIPYGMAGNIDKAKVWIVAGATAFVIGLLSSVVYYYYRAQGLAGEDAEATRVEVGALAAAGQSLSKSAEPGERDEKPVQK